MQKTKKALFIFLFIILLLPLLNQELEFIKSGYLRGYYTNARDTAFSWQMWFDGRYQKIMGDYYNDHIGFRPDFVRLNGQIDFSLFDKVSYGGMEMSPDHNLYYYNYVEDYNGMDYIGYAAISKELAQLKALQDTFARLGKSLIVVYAPSKPYYYDYRNLPKYRSLINDSTNIKTFVSIGDSLHVNQIDFNSWFVSLKGKTKDSLFSKQGIHWTMYGSLLAGDSLIRYIEKLRNIRLPHPAWTRAEHTQNARETDADMADVLNLVAPVATETFTYPEVNYTACVDCAKLKVVLDGDSFNLSMVQTGLMQHVFPEWELWLYFRDVYNNNSPGKPFAKIDNYNWRAAMSNADCIIILNTLPNLAILGDGFIEQAYKYYYPQK